MGRKQKHPEHAHRAQELMNSLLDGVVALWTGQESPELKTIAEEIEISPAKLRKLLITAGERDNNVYYDSPVAVHIRRLQSEGKTVKEIQEILGLSYTSVQGYLPHTKLIYSLDTMSAECERIRLFRSRQKTVEELNVHIGLPDQSVYLWKAVVAFRSYPFTTSGNGNRPGTKFTYEVSKPTTGDGRRYAGENVEGFGNELFITSGGEQLKKSISRSTVDLALRTALEKEIKGPKALGIPGAGSYLYPMFIRFGVITP
jgi:hypothetical protein